jgi:hypothetical protein
MAERRKPLEELVDELPPILQDEVRDFAEFLLERKTRKPVARLRQDWAGVLSSHRDEYTSFELQKKALDWRGD